MPGIEGGLIEDVDVLNCMGCFAFSPAKNAINRNCRCAHTTCTPWPGRPFDNMTSIGWMANNNHLDGIWTEGNKIINGGVYNLCNPKKYNWYHDFNRPNGWIEADVKELDEFMPREKVKVEMPWDGCDVLPKWASPE